MKSSHTEYIIEKWFRRNRLGPNVTLHTVTGFPNVQFAHHGIRQQRPDQST